ncbi:MAG: PrgI family protein [Candidatus Pacebacteria bacterium]|nr:PrgI family protein [Candidatus Paceibacterota bacterium]NUQ57708.1 PrgI family protein [Candidatus Paceibacter sp.]
MRFQVPQFIEVESKIFGPLTFKQFVYLAGGAGIIFLLHVALPFFLTVIFAAPVGGLAIALAFYKVNNRPFMEVMENAFHYFTGPKIYVWKKEKIKPASSVEELLAAKSKALPAQPYIPKLTKSKLKELSWSLDIKHNIK